MMSVATTTKSFAALLSDTLKIVSITHILAMVVLVCESISTTDHIKPS
jgi:hypothetical protein